MSVELEVSRSAGNHVIREFLLRFGSLGLENAPVSAAR